MLSSCLLNHLNIVTTQVIFDRALIVKLLYGCGLRLFECLQLRVHCLNFDMGIVTVHDNNDLYSYD
ncbi:MAG: tyrosine-type recombinase/integrase [Desulfobacterales bacterium]|nr:tyrosine-type recombinase/integrase [Desulfobacterales bacterium]